MRSTPGHDLQDAAEKTIGFFARLAKRIEDFWQRVTEGLQIQVLWSQFAAEARESYSLYRREVDWAALERESGGRRFSKTVSALFWAMILKLSPARRVFLLIALLLGLLALTHGQVTSSDGKLAVGLPANFTLVLTALGALVFLLALELADRVTMKRDLEIAREIQRWLVPEVPPRVPGLEIAFASRSANTVGGDFYDAFVLDGDKSPAEGQRLLLVVADVAGKSVPAALLMATFQASLRSLAARCASLPELVEGMNRYACAHSLNGRRFTTAFFGQLDPATRALTYVRAGHSVPLVVRACGGIERLEEGQLPLGIDLAARYGSNVVALAPGDVLIVYTDGVIEAANTNDEEFGEARLEAAVTASAGRSAEETLKYLMASVESFVGRTRQRDDITCLVLRVA